jgi:2-deoxy-D-gluconate 3-dehydrogenase
MSLFDLSDRVAIVTGGNSGIGLGMAEGLASAGATVVLADAMPRRAKRLCDASRKPAAKPSSPRSM